MTSKHSLCLIRLPETSYVKILPVKPVDQQSIYLQPYETVQINS